MRPIRPSIFSVVEFPKGEDEMTMRDIIEWTKVTTRTLESAAGIPTQEEAIYVNKRFGQLCEALAKSQGVSAGHLGYFINEIVNTEMQLLATAAQEAGVNEQSL
jgi:hypothetical protein